MSTKITGPSSKPTAQNPAHSFKQVVKVIPNATKVTPIPGISNPDVQAGTMGLDVKHLGGQ